MGVEGSYQNFKGAMGCAQFEAFVSTPEGLCLRKNPIKAGGERQPEDPCPRSSVCGVGWEVLP